MKKIFKQIVIQIIVLLVVMFGLLSLLYGASGHTIFTMIGGIIIGIPANYIWLKQLKKII